MTDTSKQSAKSGVAAGCIALFGLPFLLVGIFLLGQLVFRLIDGRPPDDAALQGIMGLAFAAAGLGIMLAARYGKRKHDDAERLKAAHPGKPWLWDAGWAAGRARSSERGALVTAWVLTVLWNSISSTVFLFLPEELDKGNNAALLGLLFPLAGLGFLIWAFRATARFRKFGTSELEFGTVPVPIGGTFAGEVRTRMDVPPESMRLRLTCVRRVEGDESTSESLLWEEELEVPVESMRREALGAVVPFEFGIPADAPSSDRDSSPASIHWRLRAEAAVSGVDYSSRFDVPVFAAPESVVAASRTSLAARNASSRTAAPFDPQDATIDIEPGPGGGTEFRFPAARSPGAATAMTVMAVIFVGAAIGIRVAGAPLIFPIVIGAFGALIVAAAIDLWLSTTRVEIGNGLVTVRNAVLGVGRTHAIEAGDVREVHLKIGMSQAETATQSARAWYDIAILTKSGRKITAGRHIARKREAERVVNEMRRALDLET